MTYEEEKATLVSLKGELLGILTRYAGFPAGDMAFQAILTAIANLDVLLNYRNSEDSNAK